MFEAISCETLLVASNIALRSVIDPALLFDANSVESLADALLMRWICPWRSRVSRINIAHSLRVNIVLLRLRSGCVVRSCIYEISYKIFLASRRISCIEKLSVDGEILMSVDRKLLVITSWLGATRFLLEDDASYGIDLEFDAEKFGLFRKSFCLRVVRQLNRVLLITTAFREARRVLSRRSCRCYSIMFPVRSFRWRDMLWRVIATCGFSVCVSSSLRALLASLIMCLSVLCWSGWQRLALPFVGFWIAYCFD